MEILALDVSTVTMGHAGDAHRPMLFESIGISQVTWLIPIL